MKLVTCDNDEKVIKHLTKTLQHHLHRGERVLWLIPGGSAIVVAARVSQALKDEPNLANLIVGLTDERYGEPNHPNENWVQIIQAGFGLPPQIFHRILHGEPRPATTVAYESFLYEALDSTDYKIGLFGMGADGHTAGIKPGSSGITDEVLAVDLTSEDFERITMTTGAIKQLDETVVYAFGGSKYPQIKQLLENDYQLSDQPAQVHKQVEQSTLFTDYAKGK